LAYSVVESFIKTLRFEKRIRDLEKLQARETAAAIAETPPTAFGAIEGVIYLGASLKPSAANSCPPKPNSPAVKSARTNPLPPYWLGFALNGRVQPDHFASGIIVRETDVPAFSEVPIEVARCFSPLINE
jgi:hypothetical protein